KTSKDAHASATKASFTSTLTPRRQYQRLSVEQPCPSSCLGARDPRLGTQDQVFKQRPVSRYAQDTNTQEGG
ncbi:hypothetical protein PIB30_114943, partial [Stylosanthes scabra]|nr:hypothetical protein [Stylosanthes scabra]